MTNWPTVDKVVQLSYCSQTDKYKSLRREAKNYRNRTNKSVK